MSDDHAAEEAARQDALALVAGLHVCTLATCGSDGLPHAVSLFYAHDGFDLYWLSDPATRHSRHLADASRGRGAVTIAGDCQDFADIRGVQMSGAVHRLDGPLEIAAGLARLTGRYGFLAHLLGRPTGLVDAMRKAAVYRLRPEWVTFIDNSKGFGHKTTFRPRS